MPRSEKTDLSRNFPPETEFSATLSHLLSRHPLTPSSLKSLAWLINSLRPSISVRPSVLSGRHLFRIIKARKSRDDGTIDDEKKGEDKQGLLVSMGEKETDDGRAAKKDPMMKWVKFTYKASNCLQMQIV